MNPEDGDSYEFDEFRLEPSERLLLRNGQPVPLSPRAFDLLVFLVRNGGRLATKDQIMAAVWSGTVVEDANLTVTISALRKALGDKDGGSQHIETVPRQGYRFIARVSDRPVDEKRNGSVSQLTLQAHASGIASGSHATVQEVVAAVRSEDGSPPPPPAALEPSAAAAEPQAASADDTPPISASAAATSAPRRLLIGLVLCGLALGALAFLYFWRPTWDRVTAHPRNLAILPLRNLKQDPDTEFLGYSLADALITKLDYVSSLSVRPSSAVEKYRGKVIDPRAVANDLKVDTLLTGGFLREGDKLRITYQLIDVPTEKLLGRGTIDLRYDNLLHVQDDVVARIVRDLSLKLSPAETARLKPDFSTNPLAYEYYLRGVDLHGQHKFPLAIPMLERSTQLDPNYALAWAYLGAAYTSDAAFELGGREQYRRAQAAYERALTLDPSQLDARMFLANLLIDTGRVEEAVPLLRAALRESDGYAPLHWELGYAYRFAGMLAESIGECERALQIDPSVRSNGSILNTYLYRGEYRKFLASLPPTGEDAFVTFYRGLGEYYLADWNAAGRHFDRAFEMNVSLYTRIGKALSDTIKGQRADGLEVLKNLEAEIERRGVGDPEGEYKLAQAYVALGEYESALRVLRLSVAGGFFPYPYLATDPLLDPLREQKAFADILDTALARHNAFQARFFH
jgi:DNA-binding winged helix-turn-helix (wHTH) protein/TolB-like protein/Tfp pilus assembly protein PilF